MLPGTYIFIAIHHALHHYRDGCACSLTWASITKFFDALLPWKWGVDGGQEKHEEQNNQAPTMAQWLIDVMIVGCIDGTANVWGMPWHLCMLHHTNDGRGGRWRGREERGREYAALWFDAACHVMCMLCCVMLCDVCCFGFCSVMWCRSLSLSFLVCLLSLSCVRCVVAVCVVCLCVVCCVLWVLCVACCVCCVCCVVVIT